jgi:tRNA splicing ligase
MESANAKPAWAYPSKPSDDAVAKYFTKDALEYQPTETDIFITNSKGAYQRLVF